MKLVTVEEMRNIEKEADEKGLSFDMMMDRAGLGVAQVILDEVDFLEQKTVTALVGSGNNGGDALVALNALHEAGWDTKIYLARPRVINDPRIDLLVSKGVEILEYENDRSFKKLDEWLKNSSILIDGILGTGIKLPVTKELSRLFSHVNDKTSSLIVVAVDCPSGAECDTGQVDQDCIRADLTICMAAIKMGLLRIPAYEYVGELRVVDLGFPKGVQSWQQIDKFVIDLDQVSAILPERPLDAHKGTFGSVLIIAGSINYTGAALLAGKAAYKIGSGLVRLAVPGPLYTALAGHIPEVTWLVLPHELGVIEAGASEIIYNEFENVTAVLLGPGLGKEKTTSEFLNRIINMNQSHSKLHGNIGFVPKADLEDENKSKKLPPLVVDADGLKLLARIDEWYKKIPPSSILTPHPGEMAVLTGIEISEIQKDRIGIARKHAMLWNQVIVLKGAFTVVAEPGGKVAVVPVATPALARAGSGDVLAGMIVGLLGQGLSTYNAAIAGAWIHAKAGLSALKMVGHSASVLAGDVLEAIPDVLNEYFKE